MGYQEYGVWLYVVSSFFPEISNRVREIREFLSEDERWSDEADDISGKQGV